MPRQTRVLQVRNNELSDLEGFEMSPGQDILAAIETLAVSAPKIERGSARRIGHQNNRTVCHPEVLIQVNVVRQLADPAA